MNLISTYVWNICLDHDTNWAAQGVDIKHSVCYHAFSIFVIVIVLGFFCYCSQNILCFVIFFIVVEQIKKMGFINIRPFCKLMI